MSNTVNDIFTDIFNMQNVVTGASLDSMCGIWGVCRVPGESDAVLRNRLMAMSRRPEPETLRLLVLLAKLQIHSVREFFPVGVSF